MSIPPLVKIILLVSGILLPLFSILFTFLKDRKDNKSEQKSNRFNNILFCCGLAGVLLSGLGTYVSEKEKQQTEESAKILRAQDLNFQQTIDSLSIANLILSKYNREINLQNSNKLNQQLDTLSRLSFKSRNLVDSLNQSLILQAFNNKALTSLYREVAGDSSIPLIKILGNTKGNGEIRITLSNPSRYPITNITVTSLDYSPPAQTNLELTGDPIRKPREVISATQPLMLSPYEEGRLIETVHLKPQFLSRPPEAPVGELQYRVKWRNGSYSCSIPYYIRSGRIGANDIFYNSTRLNINIGNGN